MRSHRNVPSVRDQGPWALSAAEATTAAIESQARQHCIMDYHCILSPEELVSAVLRGVPVGIYGEYHPCPTR